MFAVRGRARRRHFWLPVLAASVLVAFVAILIAGLGWPGSPATSAPRVTFRAQKKLFGVGERPVLHLRLKSPRVGLLPSRVFAADLPQVTVSYNDRTVPVPSTVSPESDGFAVTIGDQHTQTKPGTYEVTAAGQTTAGQEFRVSNSFAWGAIAVNTTKSLYEPGETAQLQVGVVDSVGHTLCTAPLQLQVTDPLGHAVDVPYNTSASCQGDNYNSEPDYMSTYTTGVAGTYMLRASIKDTGYSVQTSFKVQENAPFSVQRSGLTRLYPTHSYGMQLQVTPRANFVGTVREVLPAADFTVTSVTGNGTVTKSANDVTIVWNVNWKAGVAQQLAYAFLPPVHSPAFYALQPARFIDTSNKTIFSEARGWQYVDDAALSFVKETYYSIKSSNTAPPNSSGNVSVTSTAGNTLIVLFAEAVSGTTNGLGSVTDSAGNTWVIPGANPNQNPPSNYSSGSASLVAVGYVVNASAITTINVAVANGANNTSTFAFTVEEFSNVDQVSPVDQSASVALAASVTLDTSTLTATTCDQPTTDQLMRGGNYFCSAVNELVIGLVQAGRSTYVLDNTGYPGGAPGWTGTHELAMSAAASVNTCAGAATSCGIGAYQITSVTGPYFIEWTATPNTLPVHAAGSGIMVFRQASNAAGGDKQHFFWAS